MAAQQRREQPGPGRTPTPVVPPAVVHVVSAQRERVLRKIERQAQCSRAEAEDFLGEVTVKVLAGGGSGDVRDWFHYFASASRNEGATQARERVKSERRAARQPRPAWLAGAGGDDAAEIVATRERVEEAFDALASLPELERQVFWLREVEQMTPRQVCALLRLDRRAQRYRYTHAQQLVARYVAALHPEETDGADTGLPGDLPPAPLVLLGTLSRRAPGTLPPWMNEPVAACVAALAAVSVAVHFGMIGPAPALADARPAPAPMSARASAADVGTAAPPEARAGADRQARPIPPWPGGPLAARPGFPAGSGAPGSEPPVTGTVCARGLAVVCVGTGGGEEEDAGPDWTGDRYEAFGVKLEQNVTPTCAYLPDNRAGRCREGKPDYKVKSVPLAPPPGGAVPGGT